MAGKERPDPPPPVGHRGDVAAGRLACIRILPEQSGVERAEERPPVSAAQRGGTSELTVRDDNDAPMPFGADEPADGLPQLQRSQRQVVRLGRDCVRVFSAGELGTDLDRFPACFDDRSGERRERQLVDPHQPQPAGVGDVDTLPQSLRADEQPTAVLAVGECPDGALVADDERGVHAGLIGTAAQLGGQVIGDAASGRPGGRQHHRARRRTRRVHRAAARRSARGPAGSSRRHHPAR